MTRYPVFLIVALAAAALLLTGAVGRQSSPSPPPTVTASPEESAEVAQLLDAAAETYALPRVAWAEMTLSQKVWDEGEVREVQGRYLAAPGHRLRLELGVQVGGTRGQVEVVCDGTSLRQSQRIGSGPPVVTWVALPALTGPGAVAERNSILLDQAFLGVGPLVKLLRERMQGLSRRPARWQGVEAIQVTGSWPEDPAKLAELAGWPRPGCPPRLCSVYLDAKTLWPYRVEWWGGVKPGDVSVPLLQLEFRDPVLNRPLPPERCAREFTLPPG